METIYSNGAPTKSTPAVVGDLYVDMNTNTVYRCAKVNTDASDLGLVKITAYHVTNRTYTWELMVPTEIPDTPDEPEVPDTPDEPEIPDEPDTPDGRGELYGTLTVSPEGNYAYCNRNIVGLGLEPGKQYFIEDTLFIAADDESGEGYVAPPVGTRFHGVDGVLYYVEYHGGGTGVNIMRVDGAPISLDHINFYYVSGDEPDEPDTPDGPVDAVKGELLFSLTEEELAYGVANTPLEAGKGYFVEDTYFVAVAGGANDCYVCVPDGVAIDNGHNFGYASANAETWYVGWDNAPESIPVNFYKVVGENYGGNGGGTTPDAPTDVHQKGELLASLTEQELYSGIQVGTFTILEAGKGYFLEDVYFVAQDQGYYIAPPHDTVVDNGHNNSKVQWDGSSWGAYDWYNAPDSTPVNFYKVVGETYGSDQPDTPTDGFAKGEAISGCTHEANGWYWEPSCMDGKQYYIEDTLFTATYAEGCDGIPPYGTEFTKNGVTYRVLDEADSENYGHRIRIWDVTNNRYANEGSFAVYKVVGETYDW